MLSVIIQHVQSDPNVAAIMIHPSNVNISAGSTFTIDVTVENVTDLYIWQVQIAYCPSVLNGTSGWLPEGHIFQGKNVVEVTPTTTHVNFEVCNISDVDLQDPLSSIWKRVDMPWQHYSLNNWIDRDSSGNLTVHDVAWLLSSDERFYYVKSLYFYYDGTIRMEVEYGYVEYGCSLIGAEASFNGSGMMCQVEFKGIGGGESFLNFTNYVSGTGLFNSAVEEILFDVQSSVVSVEGIHDVAVSYVIPQEDYVEEGELISLAVTVVNQGDYEENFDVTVFYDSTSVGTHAVFLFSKNAITLTFYWDTTNVPPGTYTVSAEASIVDGEVITQNNILVDGSVVVLRSSPITIYVDDDNILGPWDGTEEYPYMNMTSALKQALMNDTIYVFNGTYFENVVVKKSVSFIGEDSSGTIIDGGNKGPTFKVLADRVKIVNFTITHGEYYGIQLYNSSNCKISHNIISENFHGIWLVRSSYNLIENNTITRNNQVGIFLLYEWAPSWSPDQDNWNNTIIGNTIFSNEWCGIRLVTSTNTVLRENTISGNQLNFGVEGWAPSHYNNDVDASNTVNGKPICYWVGRSSGLVPLDAGYVAIVNSTNIKIENLTISFNFQGILIAHSQNCTISNISFSFCEIAIDMQRAAHINVTQNTASYSAAGIRLEGVSSSFVSYNEIAHCIDGILLWGSHDNVIADNSVVDVYEFGISAISCSGNRIHHNNFVNNPQQVYTYDSTNFWDDGYPSGGNYWSDYDGTDSYFGPYQNEPGSDGIGDLAYVIDMNNQDSYPLMGPWTVVGESVKVTHMKSGVSLAFAVVTGSGITTVNVTDSGPDAPSGFKLALEPSLYYDIETTANHSGTIALSIPYNDTGMTERVENSLQLMQWNETLQQWENITTLVDIEQNVIHGETTHFSLFAFFASNVSLVHDIALTEVVQLKTVVGEGLALNLNVTVINHGDFTETFNIKAYANQTIICIYPDISLTPGQAQTIRMTWNTEGFAKGNYTLLIQADTVPGETYTADNQKVQGWIIVAMVGDLTGPEGWPDGKCDMRDVGKIARLFGASPVHPMWDPNCDVTGVVSGLPDNKIDMRDIGLVARHFGERDP